MNLQENWYCLSMQVDFNRTGNELMIAMLNFRSFLVRSNSCLSIGKPPNSPWIFNGVQLTCNLTQHFVLYRYKNKEADIKDWEERQKFQAEAEMKKIEVSKSR
jgi:hypothetical protein